MLFRVPFLTGEKYDYDKVLRIPHLIFSSVCREYDRRVCADPSWRHHAVTQLQYRYPTSVVSTENKGSDASKYKPANEHPKRTRGIWIGQLPMLGPRIPFLEREKAAYVKLRRVGLSINQIAAAFGRSTSVIHRALKRVIAHKTLRRFDMRKLPHQARMRMASFRWARMLKLLHLWELWICGERDEPP